MAILTKAIIEAFVTISSRLLISSKLIELIDSAILLYEADLLLDVINGFRFSINVSCLIT